MARKAHFVLQGKGGTGKSLVASLVTQFLAERDRLARCYDTDPVNGSFQTIPALNAQPIQLLTKSAINVKGVDKLIEAILTASKDVVVDNGAASFIPLSRYLVENDIATVLAEQSVQMVVHTVITGGGNGIDTLRGMKATIDHFAPASEIVCWVNEYFGPAKFEGVEFHNTPVYREAKDSIRGVVYLRKLDPEMFEPNFLELLDSKMTFAEALQSDQFLTMERSRLFRIRQDIWEQLERVI